MWQFFGFDLKKEIFINNLSSSTLQTVLAQSLAFSAVIFTYTLLIPRVAPAKHKVNVVTSDFTTFALTFQSDCTWMLPKAACSLVTLSPNPFFTSSAFTSCQVTYFNALLTVAVSILQAVDENCKLEICQSLCVCVFGHVCIYVCMLAFVIKANTATLKGKSALFSS